MRNYVQGDRFSPKNVLPHIHPYAFRHTAASMVIENGIDLVTAANEFGHEIPTEIIYVQ